MSDEPQKLYRELELGVVPHFKAQHINEKTAVRTNLSKKIISSHQIKHVFESHGDAIKEAERGQRGIVKADFEHIPGILSDYDDVCYGGKNQKGKDSLVFIKKIKGWYYHVVMASSGKADGSKLFFNTMYIAKIIKKRNRCNFHTPASYNLHL